MKKLKILTLSILAISTLTGCNFLEQVSSLEDQISNDLSVIESELNNYISSESLSSNEDIIENSSESIEVSFESETQIPSTSEIETPSESVPETPTDSEIEVPSESDSEPDIPSVSDSEHTSSDFEEPSIPTEKIVDDIKYEQLQINFLELGNSTTGDSTFIKAGDTDILIDAGSKQSSAETIIEFVNQYCTDGKLEYVITTHAHEDHWSGMFGRSKTENGSAAKNFKGQSVAKTGIYYYYEIGTIIDFALTNKEVTSGNNQYNYYRTARDYAISNGALHYTAAECFNNENGASSTFVLDKENNITLDILYNKYYFETSSDENNYSVCNMINYNDQHFMFTGDLEIEGEVAMASYYDGSTSEKTLPKVELFKAGHHGSKTSSNDCLLSLIEPEICCVCCCAGTTEYTFDLNNTFPTQDFITRIAAYTDRVYVTSVIDEEKSRKQGELVYESLNGNITISSNGTNIGVFASNNIIKLKDSDWFNGTVYVDDNNRLYASGGKKYNYYNSTDSGVHPTVRRVWPN